MMNLMRSKKIQWLGLCFVISLFISLHLSMARAENNSPTWEPLLKELVEINSGTQNVEGLNAIRVILKREFSKLGFEVQEFKSGAKADRVVLVASQKNSTPTVGFFAHIDTVFQKNSEFKNYTRITDRVMGPGVVDMKGGLVLILEILRELSKSNPEKLKNIKVLINDDEEIGSPDSKLILEKESEGLTAGFIFEPGNETGALVSSQSGIHWIEIAITGKAAHAGMDHKNGRNACLELAKILPEISAKTNYAHHFTVNVGTLEGGTVANIVCENAKAKLDIRYVNEADLVKLKKLIQNKIKALPMGFVGKIAIPVDIPSLQAARTEKLNHELTKFQKLNTIHVGYVADSNHLQKVKGLELAVGVGPFGGGMHNTQEFMLIQSFEDRKKLMLDWLLMKFK